MKDAGAVQNVLSVLWTCGVRELVIVVSAMGKTTNALESVWQRRNEGDFAAASTALEDMVNFHGHVAGQLFGSGHHPVYERLALLWDELKQIVDSPVSADPDYEYDRIVSFGELASTLIISAWLNDQGYAHTWLDARQLVKTDKMHREAQVDWSGTAAATSEAWNAVTETGGQRVALTQGFIGGAGQGTTTTLGREGSDYTAAILAYVLGAESVTIWKDVPGMLNADPKFFNDTQRLARISYKEAIELSYYGASVIHPKTIKPLQNEGIPLYVKSFLDPELPGTVIHTSAADDALIPSYIFKTDQVLISVSPRDFSFIVEENLSYLFGLMARERVRMNLMQHSAVSFSVCANRDSGRVTRLISQLQEDYVVRYNEPVTLITVRHYTEPVIQSLIAGKTILVEQRSRNTARYVVKD